MTPRIEELHMLSLEQSWLVMRAGTAICSCGAESTVGGKDSRALWQAAYAWHAEHKLAVQS